MNTTGFIRGYMSKNMKTEDFIGVVVSALNREFEEIKNGVKLDKINDDFIVAIDEYKLTLSKALIDSLKSPYGVDKYILEEFEKQGLILIKIEANIFNIVWKLCWSTLEIVVLVLTKISLKRQEESAFSKVRDILELYL